MNISIVIPLYNEEESLNELYNWIKAVMLKNRLSYEIIFVDDGSNDSSWQVIDRICAKDRNCNGIRFRRNYGKSAALHTGFQKAKGDVIVTMDADLQDSPEEIPEMYRMIMVDRYDLVSGWKQKRYDPISKTIPSRFFNGVARIASGIKLHDFNCGLKAYRRKVVKSIEVYGEMHRYIPILAKQAGFIRIGEKVVQHQARKYGVTKFGLDRFVKGFLDLMSLMFITKFGKKPMHLFGLLGTIMFILGFGIFLYLGINKLFFNTAGRLLADKAEFFIALVVMIFGVLFFLTGFLGELISRSGSDRNSYNIDSFAGGNIINNPNKNINKPVPQVVKNVEKPVVNVQKPNTNLQKPISKIEKPLVKEEGQAITTEENSLAPKPKKVYKRYKKPKSNNPQNPNQQKKTE